METNQIMKKMEIEDNKRIKKIRKVQRHSQSQQLDVSGNISNCMKYAKILNNQVNGDRKSKYNE